MKKRNSLIFILTLLIAFVFLTGCDDSRHQWTNVIDNHDTRNTFDLFLEKGETTEIDFNKQFKDSGIDISEIIHSSSNTGVFTVKGNRITATGMGRARLNIEIYEKKSKMHYFAISAYIYVIDKNDKNLIEVKTAQNLADMKINKTGWYILKNDIDLSVWGDWEPIGNLPGIEPANNAFSGIFINPDGYKIKNLTISSSANIHNGIYGGCYGGLFGCLEDAYIDGIKLENIFIDLTDFEGRGDSVAGGIVGSYFSGTVIRNCSVDGTVTAQNLVGGIVGGANWGRVLGCSFSGTVKSTEHVAAGIAAYGYIVKDSHAKGSVEGSFASGGIMGCAPAGYYIEDCSFTGELSGEGYKNEIIAYPTVDFISS